MQFIRRWVDRVQIWLYLAEHLVLARYLGRWGTRAGTVDPLSKTIDPVPLYTTDDYHPAKTLTVVNFDTTFNDNHTVDVTDDIVIPTTRLDVN